MSAHTSPHTSALPQRIDLITRTERHRRWPAEQKREIVAESLAPNASALATARKHGISSGQLYTWRGQMRRGELDGAGERAMRFMRLDAPRPATGQRPSGLIEIALPGGATLRVDAQVDGAALRRVIEALAGP